MKARAAPDWLTKWEYAHRGLHGQGAPENSLAAAEAAIAAGMGIECDIQLSGDHVPMVFHDWDLERLIGASGRFCDRTAADIGEMSLLGSDESPPTLRQLLRAIDGRVPLLVEVKSTGGTEIGAICEAVSAVLSEYSGPFAAISFNPWIIHWLRENEPKIPCGLVMREDEFGNTQEHEDREFALEKAQPDFMAYHIAALPNPWVTGLRKSGLPVLTWTVNSLETRARALRYTDALISEGEGVA